MRKNQIIKSICFFKKKAMDSIFMVYWGSWGGGIVGRGVNSVAEELAELFVGAELVVDSEMESPSGISMKGIAPKLLAPPPELPPPPPPPLPVTSGSFPSHF